MVTSTSSGQAAQELRERARQIRHSAQYAQGQSYREEMAEARRLENQARWLDEGGDDSDRPGADQHA